MVYRARLNQFVELPDLPTGKVSGDRGVAGDVIGIAKSGRRQDAIAPKGTIAILNDLYLTPVPSPRTGEGLGAAIVFHN